MKNIIKSSASAYKNMVSVLSSCLSNREKLNLIEEINNYRNSQKAMELYKVFFKQYVLEEAEKLWSKFTTKQKLSLDFTRPHEREICFDDFYDNVYLIKKYYSFFNIFGLMTDFKIRNISFRELHIETFFCLKVADILYSKQRELLAKKEQLREKHTCTKDKTEKWKTFSAFYEKRFGIGIYKLQCYIDEFLKQLKKQANITVSGFCKECSKKYSRQFYRYIVDCLLQKEKRKKEIENFVKQSGLPARYFGNEKTIEEVQTYINNVYCFVNGYYITIGTEECKDWNKYSKSWHNHYGPYVRVERRYVQFTKGEEKRILEVESFRGNYLFKAIAEFFNLKPVKVAKELKKVQLFECFEIKEVKKLKATFYERSLAGAVIDYCVLYQNETFHAKTLSECVQGLKKKIKARHSFENELIDKKLAYSLGFCQAGVNQFCEDNNLDIDDSYSRKELRNIVLAKKEMNCQKYKSELKKIGIVLNC